MIPKIFFGIFFVTNIFVIFIIIIILFIIAFNKFKEYYSIFESDHVFGSKGSFFEMIAQNEYILPSGKYEINPPWNNECYDAIVKILAKVISLY